MSIRIIGNDLEINGEKVARVLDIRGTLHRLLEEYIEKADTFDEIEKERDDIKEENEELKDEKQEAYNDGHSDGYAEGKKDADN